jgi:phage-related protein
LALICALSLVGNVLAFSGDAADNSLSKIKRTCQVLSCMTTCAVRPLKGLGSGVFELALKFRGDAFRIVYAVQIDEALWVIHAFKKKSTHGIKTPKRVIALAKERLKRLNEMLQ